MDRRRKARELACLPDEVVFHIVSFLPVKPFMRFKCVCKVWNTLFLDPQFSNLYGKNSPFYSIYLEDPRFKHEFLTIAETSDELLVQQTLSSVSPSRWRIYCPQSHQYLKIPCPQNPSLSCGIEFLPSNRAVKLISVHQDVNQVLSYEFLHIGPIDNITPSTTYCWRALSGQYSGGKRKTTCLDLQCFQHKTLSKSANRKGLVLFVRRGFAYCIWANENYHLDIQVDILDIANESYIGHTSLPAGTFFSDQKVQLLDWNGQLAFAQVVEDKLHALVLDGLYTKLIKWTERIVNLTFFKQDPSSINLISLFDNSILFFSRSRAFDDHVFCSIGINTGNVETMGSDDYKHDANDVNCVLYQRGLLFRRLLSSTSEKG